MIDSITIATVVKKALEVLSSNKEGRNFLGYVIGIAIFILLLPAIVLYGLFGWLGESDDSYALQNNIISYIPRENIYVIDQMDIACDNISYFFQSYGLSEQYIEKAKAIYVSYLVGRENDLHFYNNLAYCFLNMSEAVSVYDLVSEQFSIYIPPEEREIIDNIKQN